MPVAFILACAGLGFTAAHQLAARSSRHALPVEVAPKWVNFGRIAEGGVFERTVLLRNTTSQPLRVEQVGTSCGCTTTEVPTAIPPHGTAPLTVRFDAHGHLPGALHEEAFLTFGGASSSEVAVPVIGMVAHVVARSRDTLVLGGKPDASAVLTLTRLDGKPLTASVLQVPNALRAQITSVSPAVLRLAVHVAGPSMAGQHEEAVALRLNDALLPTLTIPVSWSTASRYRILPPSVNFGSVAPGAALSRNIDITGPFASGLRVVSAPPGWTAFVQKGANAFSATLTLHGSAKGGLLHSSVLLATGNAREPNITIPVYAVGETAADACKSGL